MNTNSIAERVAASEGLLKIKADALYWQNRALTLAQEAEKLKADLGQAMAKIAELEKAKPLTPPPPGDDDKPLPRLKRKGATNAG